MILQKFSLLLLLILASLSTSYGQQANQAHVEVIAQKGDGIYALLRRYQVNTPCNLEYFYKSNGLRRRQGLMQGKRYKLPIFLYTYNGNSIRSTTGINDRPWAEGVQRYNEIMHASRIKAGDYRQNRQLWVPYSQLYCRDEKLPMLEVANPHAAAGGLGMATPSTSGGNYVLRGTYPIFGPKHAQVPLISTELQGRVYYIVGGHGGPDPGAVGNYYGKSLCEDEYAYDIALRLTHNLLSRGATVYLIVRDEDDGIRSGEILPCDKDETVWVDMEIPVQQKARLIQRSDAINALYRKNKERGVSYQRVVVLHVDSNSKREKMDVYFYHKIGDSGSRKLALSLQETMKLKYDEYRKNRGYSGSVTARDLHMLRETEPTAVFIELGNIRNRNDQARFVIEGNRQLVANWLFEGLVLETKR